MADVAAVRSDIQTKGHPRPGELAALASRQHGVVALRQLAALGIGPGAVKHRVATGSLHRVYRGVYAVGHSLLPGHGRWMAAVLTYGPEAVLSHQSAATLLEIRASAAAIVHVTIPRRSRRGRSGISLHCARRLHPDDVTRRDGIPVTTVARTLLDLAEVLRPRELESAFEQADRRRLLDIGAMAKLCERSHGRRGARPVVALLSEYRGAPETRSELERRFLELCRDAGLPQPAVNVPLEGLEVDVVWSDRRLVVELDGHAFHRTRRAFERDRVRDAILQLAGYRVLRLTHHRLQREPAAVTETVRALLG